MLRARCIACNRDCPAYTGGLGEYRSNTSQKERSAQATPNRMTDYLTICRRRLPEGAGAGGVGSASGVIVSSVEADGSGGKNKP